MPIARDEREREPRLLPARQLRDGRRRHVAADVEAAQVVAERLLAGRRLEALEMPERRHVGTQRLDLMLREIADAQILMGEALARDRREHAGNRFQQRRLAGAVGAEQADSRATQEAPFDVGQYRRAGIAEARMIEQHQLTRAVSRRSERELE